MARIEKVSIANALMVYAKRWGDEWCVYVRFADSLGWYDLFCVDAQSESDARAHVSEILKRGWFDGMRFRTD